jgi:hypothetical protein
MQATGRLIILMLVLLSTASAQQERWDVELQLQGSFYTTVGADVTNSVGTVAGKVGPFITRNIQFGVGPTLTIETSSATSPQGGTSGDVTTTVTFGTTVFAVYSILLKDARTVPYFGASYYKRDFSNTKDRGWVGGNAGVKFFFAQKSAVDISLSYLTSLHAEKKGGLLIVAVGLSFLI